MLYIARRRLGMGDVRYPRLLGFLCRDDGRAVRVAVLLRLLVCYGVGYERGEEV